MNAKGIAKIAGIIVGAVLTFVAGGKFQDVPEGFCEGAGEAPVAEVAE